MLMMMKWTTTSPTTPNGADCRTYYLRYTNASASIGQLGQLGQLWMQGAARKIDA